jgi:hypothetical protein
MLRLGGLPTGAPVGEGRTWINDSYLSQVGMALIVRCGGGKALGVGASCLALLILIALLILNRLDKVGWMPTIVASLLVWSILVMQWRAAPRLASLACFAALLVVLQISFAGWRGQWLWTKVGRWTRRDWEPGSCLLRYDSQKIRLLWLAAPLFFVWANLHHDFMVGLAVLWVYLACRALEAICQRGRSGWGLVRRMALMGGVAGLATLVTPYGPWLHEWLLSGSAVDFLAAWEGPAESIVQAGSLWSVFLMVLAFALAAQAVAYRRCDLAQVITLSLIVALTIRDANRASYFALATGFWIGIPFQEFWAVVQSITLGRRRTQPIAVAFHGNSRSQSGNRFFPNPNEVLSTSRVESNGFLPSLLDPFEVGNNSHASEATKG